MATSQTTNLQLVKYGAGTDNFIRTDYNGNLDKIDQYAGNTNQAITALNGKVTTITSGNVTWDESNVSGGTERKVYLKIGRLVIANLEWTPISGRIANNNTICSGLPTPAYDSLTAMDSGNGGQQIRLNSNGNLRWFFPTNTTTTNRVNVNLVYFANE